MVCNNKYMLFLLVFRFLRDNIRDSGKDPEDEFKAIQCESMQCLARECAELDVVVEWRTTDRCRKYCLLEITS